MMEPNGPLSTNTATRREFLYTLAAQPARRPNVLLLLADQWRAQTLPMAGDEDLQAPNLARLGSDSVTFSRAYAAYPLCSPSRASILTGRFPHACRVPGNNWALAAEEPSLAALLAGAGYRTGYIGKWHLDGEANPGFVPPGERRFGFQYWAAFNRGHRYYDSVYFRDTPEPVKGPGFEPDYQTALAASFIRQNREQPFFLFVSWGPPHTPRRPPERFAQMYDAKRFQLRANVPDDYQAKAREGYAGYYGLCSAVDHNVGLLLDTLDAERLTRDTIVVFTADHGDLLGSHGLEFKNEPYEESARVPLVVRYPGRMKGGTQSDALVSLVDLAPTLASLCGVTPPDAIQGVDHSASFTSGSGPRAESVYGEGKLGQEGEWRMIVRGADKLVVNRGMEPSHLYNLAQDPFEMDNLMGRRDQRTKTDELRALLRRWMLRTSDRVPYPMPRRREAKEAV